MNRNTVKNILPLVVFILCLIPIATSTFLDLEQKKKDEEAYQEFLVRQKLERKLFLTGRFNPGLRSDFVPVPARYTTTGNPMLFHKDTFEAFLKMAAKAEQDGIKLRIASATRNFDYQKDIWEKKWSGVTLVDGKNLAKSLPDGAERFRKILEYSAAPGTSRHHWGTDIDINYAIPAYFEKGSGKREYEWLVAHAPSFGFCQTYNLKDDIRPVGYNEEKWHWSYLPLARSYTEEYKNLVSEKDLRGLPAQAGFLGDEFVSELNLINDYVLGINPECL